MLLIERNHVVQDFAPATSDPQFGEPILPGRPHARAFRLQPRCSQEIRHLCIELLVPIQDHVTISTKLSRKGYGIYGTSEPRSIGRRASHASIRLRNADVEQLFALVAVGDAVELYDERTDEVARIFGGTMAAGMAGGQ